MPPILSLRSQKFYRRAFTLIEMLLVVSLLSVTGLAVYHAIANGLRVWEYGRRYSIEEDVAIFFEKMTADLQNSYAYASIPFEGKEQKIFIPTIVRMPADQSSPDKGQIVEQLGAVEYYIQKDKKTIYRRQSNYSQALKVKKNTQANPLVSSVVGLHFTYFLVDDDKIVPQKITSGALPISIEVRMDFVEGSGSIRHLQRVINIPVGNKI